ncbi:Carbon-nitrogen hydrolase [Penicillium expansum]|uniref:nitrilase n=1 Tax=Penicillium expansum TaxID=27334 RepID=A0A0A2K0N1_PENEN|nr:Carbon-nitrogen hydrolase [Penicillium expansum]KGO38650.1 Carbon-nitrogen hydrolase [Penicillium expansum]KGO59446.1 Carbon-nitrogen hydrolase [Penicillium expansum]KGO60468.1 Carbon-nitrogen hydrolase [Penicillium expansum]
MRLTLVSILFGTALGLHHGQPAATSSTNYNNLTVAIVRAPPANWPLPVMNKNWTDVKFDLNQTVVKATHLIKDAADAGANLVVFPELWFPGYPKGIADSISMKDHIKNYFENSLVIDSPQWKTLIAAAKHNQVYVVPAFSHREGDLIYMAQALISPEGKVLLLRHKLRPSGGEREIWSDGTIEDLKVIATPYGRWGLLECWEHFHPAMTFNIQSQKETLHIASWPFTPDEGASNALPFETAEVNVAAGRTYAVNTGAPLVFASVGNVRFIDSSGLDIKVVNASVSFEDVPLVYTSFNTTGLAETAPYDADAEQSWGILGQINAGFPSYIPNVLGKLVPHKNVSISGLLALLG